MTATRIAVLASALAVPLMPAAAAQERASVPAAAVSPAPERSSAFESYRRYTDEEIADWRASNDTVARIGGHAGSIAPERNATPANQDHPVPARLQSERTDHSHGGHGPAPGRP